MAQNYSLSVIFKAIDQMTAPLNKMGAGIKKLNKPIKTVSKSLQKMGTAAIGAGRQLTSIGKNLSLKVTAPIIGFGTLAVRTALSFQKAMNMVGAVTKTTGTPALQVLIDKAKELGISTQFSATDAANAMMFLGKSGTDAATILKIIPNVLQLAAAAQLDMGSAADIVTNIMKGYGKEAHELVEVNDVLVNAFTSANTDLVLLGESFKYAGPIAKGAGLDFKTTTALIAKMGDAGIQGSMAGTAMRGMLLRLQNPTKATSKVIKALAAEMEKSNDKTEQAASKGMFDLVGMIEQLEKKGATAAQIAKLVGDRAGPGLAVLVDQGVDSIREFIKNLEEVGSAARVAEAQLEGLPGAWASLKSAFEGLQLQLMETNFGGWVEDSMRGVTKLLRRLINLNPAIQDFGVVMGVTAAVVGPALVAIGGALATFGILAKAIGVSMGVLVGTGGLIALGVAGFVSWIFVINQVYKNWNVLIREMKESLIWLWDKFIDFGNWLNNNLKIILQGILPNWALKLIGWKQITMEKGTTAGTATGLIGGMGQLTRSAADVNITLTADKGTEAKVDKVQQKKGDINVNLATVGYVGTTANWRDMM